MELVNKTIGECLKERAEVSGEQVAIEMGDWSCTFKQLEAISNLLAVRMERFEIGRGTHVGIWSINSPNWVLTFFALIQAGAVPVLINTCFKDDELTQILNYADVEVLYYGTGYKTTSYQEILERIRPDIPKVRHFVPIGETEAETISESSFGKSTCPPEALAELEERKKQIQPTDAACMIFTSGTTLIPKGVLLSHYNIVNNSAAMIESMHWDSRDRMCITVPLFHCFGLTAGIVSCILCGAAMYLLPYFKTVAVWDTIEKKRCTILNGVPSMFLALARNPQCGDRQAPGLKSGIIAGSPVSGEEYREICRRFFYMHLQPSYGQTETSPCVTIAGWDDSVERKASCAGKPIEHVDVRISNCTGKTLGPGEDGEIQVKGYNVMIAYYKLPQANAEAFTSDGWLKTGDIGHLDKYGELHITGRLKEVIIRGGENICPQEIERAIGRLDWVSQVKVVGVPAEVMQEEIAACIIPGPGCEIHKDELLDFLKPRLSHYKLPAYVLKFDSFPLNASGKIRLRELKSQAAAMVKQGKTI